MSDTPQSRWFHLTPDWLIFGLLAVEGLLFLSDRFQWPTWHKGYSVLIAVAAVGATILPMLLWLIVALIFRLRFQFSLRSLFVLTAAVALACSWLAVEMKKAKEQRKAAEVIEKLGGWVGCSDPRVPVWLRNLLGDDLFGDVGFVHLDGTLVTDPGLANLSGFAKLTQVWLENSQVTDAGIASLRGLKHLDLLDLEETQITDTGLEPVEGLTELRDLVLSGTQVTDRGLKYLQGLSQLDQLLLSGTQVTDAGLENLKGMSKLNNLYLDGTKVTGSGLEHFKE